jgi:hypothetical protein
MTVKERAVDWLEQNRDFLIDPDERVIAISHLMVSVVLMETIRSALRTGATIGFWCPDCDGGGIEESHIVVPVQEIQSREQRWFPLSCREHIRP